MKRFSLARVFLAAVVFTFGTSGSVEWSKSDDPSVGFIRGDFTVTTSAASAGEQADLSVVLPAFSSGSTLPSTVRLPPRRGHEARALQTQIFRPLGAVSCFKKLHRSATWRIAAAFDPPWLCLKPN